MICLMLPIVSLAAHRFAKPTIVADSITVDSIQMTWEKEQRVKFYRLKLMDASCTDTIQRYKIKKTRTKKRLNDLAVNTSYCIRMRALHANGNKDRWSKKLKFTTLTSTPRFGVNFIRFFSDDTDALATATQPAVVDADFSALGVDVFRMLTSADTIWSNIELPEDQYDFTNADAVLTTTVHEPIANLFGYQYASGTTPWEQLMGDSTPEKELTADQEDFIATVVDRYQDDVRYWEIGNEMAHWQLADPGAFTEEEQGAWLAAVAAVIRQHDPDAIVVLAGLISITADNADDWLTGVVAGGGTDWFDVVGYHYYGRWQAFNTERTGLQDVLEDLDIADKPVWMTETGTTSDASNTERTDYPNSTSQQAADLFRRAIQSYAAGDEMVIWHSYIGNDDDGEEFRYFSLINEDLTKQPAYYTTQLLTSEVLPFTSITVVSDTIYQIKHNDGSIAYVAWSGTSADWTIPDDMSTMTSVVPNDDGTFSWQSVAPGDTVSLDSVPLLLK